MAHGLDHDHNVIAAAVVLVADRVRDAVEQETGVTGAASAALTTLLAWAHGAPVQALADGLALSHSRTVRIVDALERDGLATRRAGRADARQSLVLLTPRGRRAARGALAARADAVRGVLGRLSAGQVEQLARAAEEVLFAEAVDRTTARQICRLCDAVACGHPGGCPATAGADARG